MWTRVWETLAIFFSIGALWVWIAEARMALPVPKGLTPLCLLLALGLMAWVFVKRIKRLHSLVEERQKEKDELTIKWPPPKRD